MHVRGVVRWQDSQIEILFVLWKTHRSEPRYPGDTRKSFQCRALQYRISGPLRVDIPESKTQKYIVGCSKGCCPDRIVHLSWTCRYWHHSMWSWHLFRDHNPRLPRQCRYRTFSAKSSVETCLDQKGRKCLPALLWHLSWQSLRTFVGKTLMKGTGDNTHRCFQGCMAKTYFRLLEKQDSWWSVLPPNMLKRLMGSRELLLNSRLHTEAHNFKSKLRAEFWYSHHASGKDELLLS